MSNDNVDMLSLSSGLPLDGQEVTITAAEFGVNIKISADATCLKLFFLTDEGEERDQDYSVGKDWAFDRTGETVEHSSGKPLRFSGQSNYGLWIANAMKAPGGEQFIRTRANELGIDFRSAAMWAGTRWELSTVVIPRTNQTTGVTTDKSVIVPVRFLGLADDDVVATPAKAAAKAAPAKAAAKSAAKAPAKGVVKPATGLDAEELEALQALALEHEDHDSFMAAAMELDWVESNGAALKAVSSTKAGSIWADRVAADNGDE